MTQALRKFVLWNYSRETSVYVLFCLLIVAFIFLTPKSWFDKRESLATQTSRLIVQRSDFSPDKTVMQKRVREMTGDPNAEIVETRERLDGSGEKVYEIYVR
ncbi:MAG: hypothetical protein ACR2IH_02830 [Pyrinomonadaceae bacterium]